MSGVRAALRPFLQSPGFTCVALLTLAAGIGACTAIFSVVDAVLLRPLPYPDADRLVVLKEVKQPVFDGEFVRPDTYRQWRAQAGSFAGLALVRDGAFNLTGEGEPVRVHVGRTTANTLSVLGVGPLFGRDFVDDEDVPGRGRVAILSHGFWQRQFGGRQDVLGRTLRLDGEPFTVVGVMPAQFQLARPFDLFTPGYGQRQDESANQHIEVIGRLRPEVTLAQAREEMRVLAERLAAQDPGRHAGWSAKVTPLRDARVGEARPALLALGGAVGLLWLVAVANVASLLLARAVARAKEMGIRSALGASRGRLARQSLAEGLSIAFMGALLGVFVAHAGVRALLALVPETLPRAGEIGVDRTTLVFTVALTLITGALFGAMPALARPQIPLGGHRVTDGRLGQRLRAGAVVVQVAMTLVLLAGAGLLMRSFVRLEQAERGWNPSGAVVLDLTLPESKYSGAAQRGAFVRQLMARVEALPGVDQAGVVQRLPSLGSLHLVYMLAVGQPRGPSLPMVKWHAVTPGLLRALGVRVLRGRGFDRGDTDGARRVVVISEALGRRLFGDGDPLGQRLAAAHRPEETAEIIGVVSDVREEGLPGEAALQAYGSYFQDPYASVSLVVRGDAAHIPAALRQAVREVDPALPVSRVRSLVAVAEQSLARQRLALTLFAVFAGVALFLAAVGVHGLTSHWVNQRARELGIRRALGARTGHVLSAVLGQTGRALFVGLALGLLGAAVLTRTLRAMLFETSAWDPVTFVVASLLMVAVGLLACAVPAWRAARLDPMATIRAE